MKQSNSYGYTLIELLASIVILATVVTFFIPIFSTIMKWSDQADEELIASNLLGKVLQELKVDSEVFNASDIPYCQSGNSFKKTYHSYAIDEKVYQVDLLACQEEQVDLVRTTIQLFSSTNQLLRESYTYVPIGGQK